MKIYAVSGLGANEKIFEKLNLPTQYDFICLPWLMPLNNESIGDYASRMADSIEQNEDFILFGLSFGGIIAQEISKIKPPQKLILFDTIKDENEKPFWISMNSKIPFVNLFPYFLLNSFYLVKSYSFLIRLFNKECPDLSTIYTLRDKRYTSWAFKEIIKWQNINHQNISIFHIHGDRDFVFPFSKIKNPIRVEGGSHICVYEKAEIISEILIEILKL